MVTRSQDNKIISENCYELSTLFLSPTAHPPAAPPTVTLPPSTVVTQGESLTLDCQPTGSPAPSVLWTRDGVEVEASESVTLASDGTLVISPVFTLDAGSYSCIASNTLGTTSAVTTLTVLGTYITVQEACQGHTHELAHYS